MCARDCAAKIEEDGSLRLFRNFLSLAGAEAVSKALTFAAFAYLARAAGPVGFGYVEFAGAVLLCAGLVVDQGFGPYGAREIAKSPQRTSQLVAEIISARIALAIAAYGAITVLALFVNRTPVITQLLLIYGLSLLFMPLMLAWVFQGHDRMQTVAIVQVIRQAIFAVVIFAFVRSATQLWVIAVAEVFAVCGAALYSLWIYRRSFQEPIRLRLAISKSLFIEGAPIGLSQMFWVVKMFGATLIVGLVASATDLGLFASAMRILVALHTFVWLYYFNLLPTMARAWAAGANSFNELIRRSMRDMAWVCAGGGLLWVAVAPMVVTGVYGQAFAPAASTLQWLAGACVAAGISGHYRYGLIAAGRQNIEMLVSALGAVLAIVWILIGYAQSGPRGAAAGLCIAEVAVWLSAWGLSRRMLGLKGHAKLLIRPLLAAALAGCALWLGSSIVPMRERALAATILFVAVALAFDVERRGRILRFFLKARRAPQPGKDLPEATQ